MPETIHTLGCYLDNHRGHYITRDVIQLAQELGYIVGPFEQWAIDTYDDNAHEENYPQEALYELADDARDWLNAGQEERVPGQNFPPIIPDGAAWDWLDGDFGLYSIEDLSD